MLIVLAVLPNKIQKCLPAKADQLWLVEYCAESAENLKIELDPKLIMNNILKLGYLVLEGLFLYFWECCCKSVMDSITSL